MSKSWKPRVALLVNVIAPSRVGVYSRLASTLELVILHGGTECNRTTWEGVKVEGARLRRVWGWQLRLTKREQRRAVDTWFLHVEPGYLTSLIREKPDAIITFEMGFRTLVALAYGSWFKKPVWVWWGGTLHTERRVGRFRKLLRRVLARWTRQWISYGQTSTEYLLFLGVPRERILQIQNCVDESVYTAPAGPVFTVEPKPVLLYVGQMIGRKGVAEFLRAASRLQSEGLKFSLLLVGNGPDVAALRKVATELGLENIHFHPAQPPEAMAGIYRSADALVFPTMEDVWGLVANEAVLSGVPVLCSRYAGCALELFTPECIFDPADEEQFVSALRRTVTGQLSRTDASRLKSSLEIGRMIADSVLRSVGRASSGARAATAAD